MPTPFKSNLTPYDTGLRAEPKPWVSPHSKVSTTNPAENFGKVDFDDDESATICSVHVERNDDGSYTVHVQPMRDDDQLDVKLHEA